jgi:hypothetical protein
MSEEQQQSGDHCRRCDRKGFELFLVSYYNGYGREGDNTLEARVCRDCRAQLGEQVAKVFSKAEPFPPVEINAGQALMVGVVSGLIKYIKEMEKEFPVGTPVDFVGPEGRQVLATGVIEEWDYTKWNCRLAGGKYARFNSLGYNIKLRKAAVTP